MRKLLCILPLLWLTGCIKSYEHTLILDNNSLYDIQVISYSALPDFSDTVNVDFGAEKVLFHSTTKDHAGLACIDNIDSIAVTVRFGNFEGNMMDDNSWEIEQIDRSYQQITFCTFEFNEHNVK